jgi:iron complex transport system substrate-binding protein
MFDESSRDLLANRGIPVLIESTSDPEYLPGLVEKLGKVLDAEARAEEVLAAISGFEAEVGDFVAAAQAAGAEKPPVYFENRKTYKSTNRSTGHHRSIELAGGINIAADEPVRSPVLSPEYIVRRNPRVIVRRVSGDAGPEALGKMLETLYQRPSLKSVSAVVNENVHIIKSDLFIALRYPAGTAYFASWFYPGYTGGGGSEGSSAEAPGLDPEDLHRRLVTVLYGGEEWEKVRETYVYP